MPTDPNIILQGAQPNDPMQTYGRMMTIRAMTDQSNMNALRQKQLQGALDDQEALRTIYGQSVGPDGSLDYGKAASIAAQRNGNLVPGIVKQGVDYKSAMLGLDKAKLDNFKLKMDNAKSVNEREGGVFAAALQDPNLTPDQRSAVVVRGYAQMARDGLLTDEEASRRAAMIPGGDAFINFARERVLEAQQADKALEMLKAHYAELNLGGETKIVNQDPWGQRPPETVATYKRTAPPINEGGFDEFDGELLGSMAARGVSIPAGMRSRQQIVATLRGLRAKFPNDTPDDIAERIASGQINFNAEKRETTQAAVGAGRVAVALEEINHFAPIVLQASAAVPRERFVPVNELMQAANSQISDPDLLDLKIAINSMMNAYDQLAARGGTDVKKREAAHALLTSVTSPEALARGVAMFQREAEAARKAAEEATKPRSQRDNKDDAPDPGTRPPLESFGQPRPPIDNFGG